MKTSKRKAVIIISISLAMVLTASAVIIKTYSSSIPDFSKKTPEQVEQYMKSDQFQKLDREKRGEVMEQVMASRAKQYYEISEDQRLAYMDKLIDMMQARREEFRNRRQEFEQRRNDPNRPASPNDFQRNRGQGRGQQGRNREANAARGRARTENTTPEDRARMRAFSIAMRMRMAQRGMSGFGGPGMGPGGGRF
jgi:hypothetical protein